MNREDDPVELNLDVLDRGDKGRAAAARLTVLCKERERTDKEEQALLREAHSAHVARALESESALLSFLLDPQTKYLDRMAAALSGASLVTAERLEALWKATADLELIGARGPDPCAILRDCSMRVRNPNYVPDPSRSIEILGRTICWAPQTFHTTMKQRENASLLWQVGLALPALMGQVGLHYRSAERYPELVAAGWEWSPANHTESRIRATAMMYGPRDSPLRIETTMRLALEKQWLDVPSANTFYARRTQELTHAAQIVILRKTTDDHLAAQAAFQIGILGKNEHHWGADGETTEKKGLRTATAMLELTRRALDVRLSLHSRYYSFASVVCRLADDPPFEPCNLEPNSSGQAEAMGKFEAWRLTKREELMREAEIEKDWLTRAAAELHTSPD